MSWKKLVYQLKKSSKRSPQIVFVTGTDTGIGKTYCTTFLVNELLKRGVCATGFKPICCGDRADAIGYWELLDKKVSLEKINPIHLRIPVAPVAQPCPSWGMVVRKIKSALNSLKKSGYRIILIEGAGGLLCPITDTKTMRELAQALRVPTLVVAADRLGVLNHTLLTLEALKVKKMRIAGVLLNRRGKKDLSTQSNARVLAKSTGASVYWI
jgi:dethiobiotin synthetase